ncbi:hypothetical protein V1525DRAFT_428836 [Lipomyces kononenkoae]|uniref:Uncharacterized protein n=1 Tax=Lipomyces kononenkoae TaxID=34357 RepID=A0ACC3SQD9_LIPKO
MPVIISTNISSTQDKGMDANYNRALNLLKSNPPEQTLDLKLSRAKYLQLENAFLKLYPESLELRYPSLSYNSFTETVTVVTAPGNIHESVASGISSVIEVDAKQYLSTYSRELAATILGYGSTTARRFRGAFEGSRKQPDGGVRYKSLDGQKVTLVVEVGFSENYARLCRSKDMWIDGHGVNVFILVCLTERPRFKNPTTVLNETLRLNLSNNRHALYLYRGHKWAGELKEAFIEIWRAGSTISSRFYLIQNGHTCDELPTTLGIRTSDLFPDHVWQASNIADRVIPFDAKKAAQEEKVAAEE